MIKLLDKTNITLRFLYSQLSENYFVGMIKSEDGIRGDEIKGAVEYDFI